ncbi:conserved hypothetical protein [Pirellula staleyi DSM 6068]|uniref:LTXXQ motif protein n=1 Tax=Pirellula staleyi (strain ATCC 27377 / DSM 6068 / ICPB 4128) TaxID=530564 RepID=D2R4W7_PIRSD|nr:hypothetical protein [Pirellula staleyi]ADB18929.1 conserved hypothetical protein [Pirellula staleyi DSM 6068]
MMNSFFSKVVIAGCILGMVAVAIGAEEGKAEKKKKGAPDPTAAMMKKLEAAELSDDQKGKIKEIAEKHAPKLKEANEAVASLLTPEQKKAKATASKEAKAAGKKGKEAAEAVSAALNLTDEQKTKMADAEKSLKEAQAAFTAAVAEVLTPEQKAKVGLGGKKKKKDA